MKVLLTDWKAITRAPSLRNLTVIWFIQNGIAISMFSKEVWCNCSAHHFVHLFIIEICNYSQIKRKQPQMFLQYSCSVTMINIVKENIYEGKFMN